MPSRHRRSLLRDATGLSTTEYVILLLVVACVGIAGWRLFGTSTFERATSASGDVGQLGQSIDGPSHGGGGRQTGRAGTRLEDATADATPPPDPKEELTMPFLLLAGALLLLIGMGARRMQAKGGGGGGEGGNGGEGGGATT